MSTEPRGAGVLLHISSLPSVDGIGDLGEASYNWVDQLQSIGAKIWQILPYNPPGAGDSPYMAISSFAGNPLYISLEKLVEQGLLSQEYSLGRPNFSDRSVNFWDVKQWKLPHLTASAKKFIEKDGESSPLFKEFCKSNQYWLEDFILFSTLKAVYDTQANEEGGVGSSWYEYWPQEYIKRDKKSLKLFKEDHSEALSIARVLQYFFFSQWNDVHQYAQSKGVKIMGDLPIFPSADSAEVWSHPELFKIDKDMKLTVVAGVPPDYFSPTGQRWGNPHYDWGRMKKDGYRWWIERFKALSLCVDMLRIDHFRGFDTAWEVPANEPTAEHGAWVDGPGYPFFEVIKKAVPHVEIIAEDLGDITPSVVALREKCEFPGMKVLQFAFGQNADGLFLSEDPFLPHNIEVNSVIYTGTHDNDTTHGWYHTLAPWEKDLVHTYFGINGENIVWDLIRAAFMSSAKYAIIPAQDILELDGSFRMNIPGTSESNWSWRIGENELKEWQASLFKQFTQIYGR